MYYKANRFVQAEMEKEAFDFGFDLYCARLNARTTGMRVPELQTIVEQGYALAASKKLKTSPVGFITKKWFSIKGRSFGYRDFDLSPDDIAKELNKCGSICPVTYENLTTGRGGDTDWSIDRIDNDIGYTPGNIVILSSRANKAKNDLDLEGMVETATTVELLSTYPQNTLSVTEWHTMISFFKGILKQKEDIPFCEMIKSSGQHLAVTNFVVMGANDCAESKELFNHVASEIGKLKVKTMIKCVIQRFKRVCVLTGDQDVNRSVMNSPKVLGIIEDLFEIMDKDAKYDKLLMSAFYSKGQPVQVTEGTFLNAVEARQVTSKNVITSPLTADIGPSFS